MTTKVAFSTIKPSKEGDYLYLTKSGSMGHARIEERNGKLAARNNSASVGFEEWEDVYLWSDPIEIKTKES